MDQYDSNLDQVDLFSKPFCKRDDKRSEGSICEHNFFEESSSVPPSYESLFGQFKETNEEHGNSLKYLKNAVRMFLGTVGCTFSLTLLLSLPMSMIIIGGMYKIKFCYKEKCCSLGAKFKDECPIEPFIPIYLIVGGSFGILKTVIEIIRQVTQNGELFSTEDKDDSSFQVDEHPIIWLFFDGILSLFLFSWFIAGNVWVYSKYKPNFVAPHHDPMNYCNKTLYMFAFWVITATYIILGMICVCTCCLGLCASCTAFFVTSANNASTQPPQPP